MRSEDSGFTVDNLLDKKDNTSKCHRELMNSQIGRDIEALEKVSVWLTENYTFDESRDPEKLV